MPKPPHAPSRIAYELVPARAAFLVITVALTGCGNGRERSAHEQRGAVPAPVRAPATTTASVPAGTSPPSNAPEAMADGSLRSRDGTPTGDLAADLARMPVWGPSFEPLPMRPDSGPSTVPQLADAARELDRLVDRAGPDGSDGTGSEGVLVCRMVVAPGRPWDSAGLFGANVEPDVTALVRFGNSMEVKARLPEDSREGAFSVPHVSLREDAPIGLRLVDRDLAVDDPIGHATTTFHPGRPIVVDVGGQATVRCRVIPASIAGARGATLLVSATRALDALATGRGARRPATDVLAGAPVDPSATDAARRFVRDAASWLGYGDPDVVRALGRIASVEGAMMRAYGNALDAAVTRAQAPGSMVRISNDVSVVMQTFRCAPGPSPGLAECELALDVTYSRILSRSGSMPVSARLLIRDAPASECIRDVDPSQGGDFVRSPGVYRTKFGCAWRGAGTPGVGVAAAVSHQSSTVVVRVR